MAIFLVGLMNWNPSSVMAQPSPAAFSKSPVGFSQLPEMLPKRSTPGFDGPVWVGAGAAGGGAAAGGGVTGGATTGGGVGAGLAEVSGGAWAIAACAASMSIVPMTIATFFISDLLRWVVRRTGEVTGNVTVKD